MSCGDEAGHGILKTRDQPNSRGKCTISRWVLKNMPNFTGNLQKKLEKFVQISQDPEAFSVKCYMKLKFTV